MTLLTEIDAYLRRANISPSYFGLKAANDGKLVARLRAGGDISVRIADRVRQWIRDNPPKRSDK